MIEQIFIENYKSIRKAKIKLNNLNVLIGSNGVGKSNFVSFFELVQAMLNQRLGSYILSRGGVERMLYQGRKQSDFIQSIIDFNNTNAFFFKLKPAIGGKSFIEYSGDYFNTKGESTKDYEKQWNKTWWDKSVEESEIIHSSKWRAGYLRTFLKSFTVYHFHDTSINSPMRQACPIGDNEKLRHDASNLAAYLYRLQINEPQTFKLIEGVIRSIAPYFKGFKLRPNPLFPDKITLEWEEVESDMYLDANSFSDGTLRFIALTTLLLQPELPETVLIDEPELGLHPTAINKLAALVRKASLKKQIILATQSVNLVNCFEPQDIIVVDRENKQTVFHRLDTEELAVWIDEYNIGDIWEKNVIGGQP
ncbi:AAA family ATPase [Bacteroides uniformis]|jgi:predicted ATPase|uniref:AAA family ATPase n=1 Tax=Bacteroides TaxID=816 RepID=UPI0039842F0C